MAWEALVRETRANPNVERGAINKALKAIKASCHDEGIVDVDKEIVIRAAAYRAAMPGIALTPMALAKHWFRVTEKKRSAQETALDALRREDDRQR